MRLVLPVLLLLLAVLPAAPLLADGPPPEPAALPPASPEPPAPPAAAAPEDQVPAPPAVPGGDLPLARVTADRVNLRVGPRIDNRPVLQLERGDVVLVVERVPGWLGVRVPRGFSVAVSTDHVAVVGPDALEVTAYDLNLRVAPPEAGQAYPAAFRDHPDKGERLPFVALADDGPLPEDGVLPPGGWAWVVAPEAIRAYVAEEYVEVLGPARDHADLLDAARHVRQETVTQLAAERREAAARRSGLRLREALGEVQLELHRLRQVGGFDKAPIVVLANRMDAALEACPDAPPRVLVLARALREDLEREIELRVARHDAEVARAQRRAAEDPPPLEEPASEVSIIGRIEYEPTPGWREDGIWILFVAGEPSFVLRLTTGGDLPHPDFRASADGVPRRILGSKPAERLFGLPVIDVRSIRAVPPDGGQDLPPVRGP